MKIIVSCSPSSNVVGRNESTKLPVVFPLQHGIYRRSVLHGLTDRGSCSLVGRSHLIISIIGLLLSPGYVSKCP